MTDTTPTSAPAGAANTAPSGGGIDLSGRTAVVTGGASGIGRACVRRLALAGAHVVVLDLDADGATAAAAEVGGQAHPVDLGDPAGLDALERLDALREADILVNNAGLQHVAPVEEFPVEKFALIQRVMLEAPFRLARLVLPGMYERGWGRLVHVSSAHGQRASAYKSAYVAAKHGLEGLSKVLALEAAGRGVTSNTICPGYVRTPLVEKQLAAQAQAHGVPEEQVLEDVLLARTPLKRLVEPDEVAELVAFVCGPATTSLTGVALTLDGGWTAS
ncbi:3-hydroxybutyrate dehydrogenase [Actinopolymorpha rutila]|uniref:3-hydroxybutyrate dehydrogenase n=1 Tax=Actinopolymorpha rutila TaxID=446787 RepID=A0A852ZEN7_9ACTN|nr:3-hydroxybutyrate dehydrogenase [Actinopolymorpha rutila]NYH90328.1 3-hydroxybutyrate dehydrogenase [Actinopolymorpha rutila]